MKKVVQVRNLRIGEGIPKICVPIVGVTREEILREAKTVKEVNMDLVEWRVDWFEDVEKIEKVKEIAIELRKELKDTPILFTFRTANEGGERETAIDRYVSLNKEIIESGLIDIVDVELFTGEQYVQEIIKTAHKCGVKVIVSNHDFHKTPSKEEMVSRMIKMQQIGADLPKLAVMPQSKRDVLELLLATDEMNTTYATCPIITMSMSEKGVISRISGEVFGSALTFGAAEKGSAPGQMPVKDLAMILKGLHESIK